MSERFEIYKCDVCGNVVEVLFSGDGELVCCGKPMKLQEVKTTDIGNEKHVPVIEKTNYNTTVKVGEIPHPMLKEHYIQMIEVFEDNTLLRKYLNFDDEPEFVINDSKQYSKAREYCNIHGLWKNQ